MPGVLTGLIPACHTPFDRDGGLNLAAVELRRRFFGERDCAASSSPARRASFRR